MTAVLLVLPYHTVGHFHEAEILQSNAKSWWFLLTSVYYEYCLYLEFNRESNCFIVVTSSRLDIYPKTINLVSPLVTATRNKWILGISFYALFGMAFFPNKNSPHIFLYFFYLCFDGTWVTILWQNYKSWKVFLPCFCGILFEDSVTLPCRPRAKLQSHLCPWADPLLLGIKTWAQLVTA